MFLKRLEINGFKSFPDKIKLDFPAGITAVVGPNGSGKSNIADAIRWVMGEQSAKSLRGAKMEDVIFAGTKHRRAMGYAEVKMLIDNTNNLLPIAFSEVTVARRVFRSGESEYLINNSPCRMKDVHQLFMDTGVGREGYSIIGQGRVDEILSSKSEDRRHLFEEAAGIVKYKTRRHEAFLKLESEKQNLSRVDDLIQELYNQMEPLGQQAEQAKTYLLLRDEYKTIHVNLFLKEAEQAEEQEKTTRELLLNISEQSRQTEQQLAHGKETAAILKDREAKADESYKEANRQIIKLVTEIEKAESNMRLTERITKEIEQRDITINQKELDLKKEKAAQSEYEENLKIEDPKESGINQKIAELSENQIKLRTERDNLLSKATAAQKELHGIISTQKLLLEMERDYEGYYASVKAVLRKRESDQTFGQGIFGTTGSLLNVPRANEQAISIALGGAAQNIVTATEADAKRAIDFLKATKSGRATFLPISAMKARSISSEMDRLLKEQGVVGLANSLVTYDPVYGPVFSHLLGNIFIIEHLNRAIDLSKKYRQSYRMVTLDGDQLSPGGSMTGGSQGHQATNLISRSRQISEMESQIKELQSQIHNFEILAQNLTVKEGEITQKITSLKQEQQAELTDHKVYMSSLNQSLQTAKDNVNRTVNELDQFKLEKATLEAELAALSKETGGHKTELRGQLETYQRELGAIEEEIAKIRNHITGCEEEYSKDMEIMAQLSRESARLEARQEQIEAESRRLHNEVWESYGLTYKSAQDFNNPEHTISFLRKEEKRLKAEISELGPVNVGAIEAYQALRERYDFLDSQRQDIKKGEEQLQEVIQKLTEQMEEQFARQFTLMARHFDDVFREMFGGGSAGLTMSDPANVLESGIEIKAEPPGKNLQNLSLLSGGERALTAIALLFGILRMKPSPFCVLDEIEAALDDTNVMRFAQFLRIHGTDTQFIIITHRKGSMECADTLYGVTMQEMGISTMVSVDFRLTEE